MPRPLRPSARLTTAVLAAVAAGLLAATTTAVVPARATLAIPVDCSSGPVTLAWDDVTYDLDGNCGLVRVTADDATVSMPTAVRLVVAGRGNTIVAKPVAELVVRGRGHDVRPVSVQRLRLASPRSVVDVDGLVESARLGRSGATLRADQVSILRVEGSGHTVRAGTGFRAELAGDRTVASFRRLEEVAVTGDRNQVRVRVGVTEVRDRGARNDVRVHSRG
ncbi:hypothetical protein [Nocardioides euryhalodurans]|uniref:DUF3060 domain-containing protein n=1 Tax=Nocardioides euryhalodurans TaxID=2518370 RepID=A0A4V1BDJ6_9ACTN|nr:hypothetical protein [Nocardioides euryhalodurans]QBR91352.1 hypothetical protein EXE57_03005 [Nocardioides euryhalodurans]